MSCKHLFLDVYEEYLIYARKEQKNSSFSTLQYNFNLHILPFFKNMNLEDITSKDILEWENSILKHNFRNNYNRGLYYLLSGFFQYCKVFYKFDKSIITNVGCFKRKYEKDTRDHYILDDFNKFISCVEGEVYIQFFNFLYYTGVRKGEAMALTFNDIKGNFVYINKTMESHGNREITPPKTQSSVRQLIIDDKLKQDLLHLKTIYEKEYDFNDDFLVFGGVKPLSPSTIDRKKKKACEKAGIRKITVHQFRHSHATLLLNNNIPITEVSKRLGHSKVSTTLDIYSHSDETQEKRVFDTLNSLRL